MGTLLEVVGVSKKFGGLQALRDLSLHADCGEIVGIIGPNGAGKTTLIHVVSGVLAPDGGRVVLRGRDITRWPAHRRAASGLVRTFQGTDIYREQTVRENLIRGAFLRLYPGFWATLFQTPRARHTAAAALGKAREVEEALGLDVVAEEVAGNLPYGYQKIVGIGIALTADPSVILLDEPAAGLNPDEASHVLDVIRRVNERGVTVVVTDHNVGFMARLCRRLVVMHYGEKLAEGRPADVLGDPSVIEAYLGDAYEFPGSG